MITTSKVSSVQLKQIDTEEGTVNAKCTFRENWLSGVSSVFPNYFVILNKSLVLSLDGSFLTCKMRGLDFQISKGSFTSDILSFHNSW